MPLPKISKFTKFGGVLDNKQFLKFLRDYRLESDQLSGSNVYVKSGVMYLPYFAFHN